MVSKSVVYLFATLSLINIFVTFQNPDHDYQGEFNPAHDPSIGMYGEREHPVEEQSGPDTLSTRIMNKANLGWGGAMNGPSRFFSELKEKTGKTLPELDKLGVINSTHFTPESIEHAPCNPDYKEVNAYCQDTCHYRGKNKGSCNKNNKSCDCED